MLRCPVVYASRKMDGASHARKEEESAWHPLNARRILGSSVHPPRASWTWSTRQQPEERAFVERAARGASRRLTLAVLLKSFQHLGYLPPLDHVPDVIITHLRQALQLPADTVVQL